MSLKPTLVSAGPRIALLTFAAALLSLLMLTWTPAGAQTGGTPTTTATTTATGTGTATGTATTTRTATTTQTAPTVAGTGSGMVESSDAGASAFILIAGGVIIATASLSIAVASRKHQS